MHYCRRDSHATSRTPIYANITQTGRIRVYCGWFWVVLVGFVGFEGGLGWFWLVLLVVLGRFGWFWLVPCFSGHQHGGQKPSETSVTEFCYKRVNLCLEELKNIKIIFFLEQELFR